MCTWIIIILIAIIVIYDVKISVPILCLIVYITEVLILCLMYITEVTGLRQLVSNDYLI